MGRHDQHEDDLYVPCLASENKRRLFGAIFNMDKLLVSFTGRPSLLSHRFVSTPLPLDLPDEVLLSDEATIQQAFHSLEPGGWCGGSRLYQTTFLRGRVMLAYIRNELIECALDTKKQVSLEQIMYAPVLLCLDIKGLRLTDTHRQRHKKSCTGDILCIPRSREVHTRNPCKPRS